MYGFMELYSEAVVNYEAYFELADTHALAPTKRDLLGFANALYLVGQCSRINELGLQERYEQLLKEHSVMPTINNHDIAESADPLSRGHFRLLKSGCRALHGQWGEMFDEQRRIDGLFRAAFTGSPQSRSSTNSEVASKLDLEEYRRGRIEVAGENLWLRVLSQIHVWRFREPAADSLGSCSGEPALTERPSEILNDGWLKATPGQLVVLNRLQLPVASTLRRGVIDGQPRVIQFLTAADMESLTLNGFRARFIDQNAPVLFEFPAMRTWAAASAWATPQKFARRHGSEEFRARQTNPYAEKSKVPTRWVTLADLVKTTLSAGNNGTDRYYVFNKLDLGSPLLDDLPPFEEIMPPVAGRYFYTPSDATHDQTIGRYSLALGPALSGSQPHSHSAAWSALIRGRKRWFIWPAHCMYTGYEQGETIVEWVERALPELRVRGKHCAPIEFEQSPGEVVFVPSNWGHAVLYLEPSMSINAQVGHPANLSLAVDQALNDFSTTDMPGAPQ